MNPVLLFYIFVGAAVLWVLLSWLFPKIGEILKETKEGIESFMEDEDEDE